MTCMYSLRVFLTRPSSGSNPNDRDRDWIKGQVDGSINIGNREKHCINEEREKEEER